MTIFIIILTLKILNSNMFEYEKKTLNVTLIEIYLWQKKINLILVPI